MQLRFRIMWMAYVQEIEIVDLESAVKNLSQQFSNLAFDAHHEAIYGMGRFYTYEECEKIGDTYDKAEEVCDEYLQGKRSISFLVHELADLEMYSFLKKLKPYLPPSLVIVCDSDDSESEESDHSDDENNDNMEDKVQKLNNAN